MSELSSSKLLVSVRMIIGRISKLICLTEDLSHIVSYTAEQTEQKTFLQKVKSKVLPEPQGP